MAENFNIHIEKGYLRIDAQIPLASNGEEIEAFIHELKFQLLGDKKLKDYRPINLPPQELNEKDAARYAACGCIPRRARLQKGGSVLRAFGPFVKTVRPENFQPCG